MNSTKKLFIFLTICIFIISACSAKPKVVWETYTPAGFSEALNANQPIMVDFYADWCVTCHELESYTYTNPAVINTIQKFKRFKIDLTTEGNKEMTDFADRFGVQGLPTIIFLDSKGNELKEIRIEGFTEPAEFVKTANQALELYGKHADTK